jgi:asparagine synthase (glutamine-hydrolysing)
VELETLQKMAEAAAHRGPDGIRYWRDGSAGLVHLALNVTPESLRERQPLVSRRGDLVLAADARVDNRDELIRTLTSKGYLRDRAPTDADVILAAYQCWGEACPEHIIGDFAFVIWDAVRRSLFAARDPMAMRALYYRVEPRRVLFATEVKQILAAPHVPAQIFDPAVGAHLAGHAGEPGWTFYDGISQLPPAHALMTDAAGNRTWRYWDIDLGFRIEYADEGEYAEHFLEIFKEAVRCRLRSTKPVGIFLSGGMDSTSAASTAGWLLRRGGPAGDPHPGLRTYSWAFEELTQCDERHISDGVVRHYDFPATYIAAEDAWPLKDYPAHGPDLDDPFTIVYQALTELGLAAAKAEGVGVMLSGHRGDLMTGMWIFDYLGLLRTGRWWELWQELRAYKRINSVPIHRATDFYLLGPIMRSLWPQDRAERLRRLLRYPVRRVLGRRQPPSPWPPWMQAEFAERVGVADMARQNSPQPEMDNFARNERYGAIFMPMHMRVAAWGDRLYSRYGLADADPWGDRRIASFVLAVPQSAINRAGENKRLVRRSMSGVMPEEVRQAARKCSPGPLYHRAIKEQARDTVLALIRESRAGACGYVDDRALTAYYEAFRREQIREDHRFWYTLTLEMWLRQHWS